jgi:hypothetical protein
MLKVANCLCRTETGFRLIVLVICAGLLPALFAAEDVLTGEEIAANLERADRIREQNVRDFSIVREYSLSNQRGDKATVTRVKVMYGPNAKMTYLILGETGSEGLFRYVIRKIVRAEVDNSGTADRKKTRVSLDNYTFQLMGTEALDGRLCHVLEITPRRKSKFLVAGKAWVDAQEHAVIRLEGRPTANVSFWARNAFVIQEFRKLGDYWVLDRNHSTVEARFLGRLELKVMLRPDSLSADFANPLPQWEAAASILPVKQVPE